MAKKVITSKTKTKTNSKKVAVVKSTGSAKKTTTKSTAKPKSPSKVVADKTLNTSKAPVKATSKSKKVSVSGKTSTVSLSKVKVETSSVFDDIKSNSYVESPKKTKFPSIKEAMRNSNTIKMFKNPWIEKLSHVHPLTPIIIYVPVVLLSTYVYFFRENSGIFSFLIFYITGAFIWTISEYTLHRFVFHPPFSESYLKWFYFYVHGVHHEVPSDATRLVMPPGASIPLAVFVFFLFRALLPNDYLGFFAGFVSGYLVYDFLHFSTHFFSFEWEWFKKLKKHHNVHHYNSARKNYGVSNSLWDHVFSTKYRN